MPEEQEKKDVVNATEHGKDSGLETGWNYYLVDTLLGFVC